MAFYYDNYMQFLKSNVTAVFAVSGFFALEFMRFLQGKNIQIPEDIQIIGFDDNMASRESNPSHFEIDCIGVVVVFERLDVPLHALQLDVLCLCRRGREHHAEQCACSEDIFVDFHNRFCS